ncbi:hypothetical protein PLESTF_001334500 [Pleodorina starrii]|nr:hypothetical protein PLESTF_001334500 [Pleodorina starrii]
MNANMQAAPHRCETTSARPATRCHAPLLYLTMDSSSCNTSGLCWDVRNAATSRICICFFEQARAGRAARRREAAKDSLGASELRTSLESSFILPAPWTSADVQLYDIADSEAALLDRSGRQASLPAAFGRQSQRRMGAYVVVARRRSTAHWTSCGPSVPETGNLPPNAGQAPTSHYRFSRRVRVVTTGYVSEGWSGSGSSPCGESKGPRHFGWRSSHERQHASCSPSLRDDVRQAGNSVSCPTAVPYYGQLLLQHQRLVLGLRSHGQRPPCVRIRSLESSLAQQLAQMPLSCEPCCEWSCGVTVPSSLVLDNPTMFDNAALLEERTASAAAAVEEESSDDAARLAAAPLQLREAAKDSLGASELRTSLESSFILPAPWTSADVQLYDIADSEAALLDRSGRQASLPAAFGRQSQRRMGAYVVVARRRSTAHWTRCIRRRPWSIPRPSKQRAQRRRGSPVVQLWPVSSGDRQPASKCWTGTHEPLHGLAVRIWPSTAPPPSSASAQPSPAQPSSAQPSSAQPSSAQPSPAQLSSAQLSPAQHSSAQPLTFIPLTLIPLYLHPPHLPPLTVIPLIIIPLTFIPPPPPTTTAGSPDACGSSPRATFQKVGAAAAHHLAESRSGHATLVGGAPMNANMQAAPHRCETTSARPATRCHAPLLYLTMDSSSCNTRGLCWDVRNAATSRICICFFEQARAGRAARRREAAKDSLGASELRTSLESSFILPAPWTSADVQLYDIADSEAALLDRSGRQASLPAAFGRQSQRRMGASLDKVHTEASLEHSTPLQTTSSASPRVACRAAVARQGSYQYAPACCKRSLPAARRPSNNSTAARLQLRPLRSTHNVQVGLDGVG